MTTIKKPTQFVVEACPVCRDRLPMVEVEGTQARCGACGSQFPRDRGRARALRAATSPQSPRKPLGRPSQGTQGAFLALGARGLGGAGRGSARFREDVRAQIVERDGEHRALEGKFRRPGTETQDPC